MLNNWKFIDFNIRVRDGFFVNAGQLTLCWGFNYLHDEQNVLYYGTRSTLLKFMAGFHNIDILFMHGGLKSKLETHKNVWFLHLMNVVVRWSTDEWRHWTRCNSRIHCFWPSFGFCGRKTSWLVCPKYRLILL